MLRVLTRLALLSGLIVWIVPGLTAESPAHVSSGRVLAIVRLKQPGAASLVAGETLRAFDSQSVDPRVRDARRARRDSLIASRMGALTETDRGRVSAEIDRRGGRVIYSLAAVNAVVAEVGPDDISALRQRTDVAEVIIDEPRQAHIEVAAQSLLVPTFWTAGYQGGAVDVAVIDTGLYVQHGAFVGRASSVLSHVFHDSAQLMSNYWDVPTDPDDYAGHGTFVGGIVFSQGDSAGPARKGMSYGIDKFYNIKAGYLTYPSGGSSLLSDLMAGVDWALLSADPPEVFNYSYGARVSTDDDLYTQFWDGVVDTYNKIATISAGNSGPSSVGSPGMAYNILSVANINNLNTATRTDDVIASSSSGGPTPGGRKKPDLAAPGTSLLMPSNYGPALWSRATGTSFSAPAVAGVAALLIDAGVADPRAVKAVLINTADFMNGAAGWDARFGWGYVNGDRAFTNRTNVILTTLTGSGSTSRRLFERSAAATTKATAVWHRHVSYQTGGLPTASTLNNVNLQLYSRDTGELRATSASTIDNVEQVVNGGSEGMVLSLVGTSPFSGTETVALAHSGGFVPRSGPAIDVVLSSNTTVDPASTFTLTATVGNPGDMRGHGYQVALTLPSGYVLVQGALQGTVGSLDVSASSSTSWVIRAPASSQTAGTFTVTATASAYGLSWQASAQRTVTTSLGCGYTVSPTLATFAPEGGSTMVTVSAPQGCSWSITGSESWLTISPLSGSGNGTVTLTAPVDAAAGRTTSLTVAGTSVSVVQSGAISRTYYLAEGSTKSIFTLDVAVANPHDVATSIRVRFLRPSGAPLEQVRQLAPKSRLTLHVDTIPGLESTDVSTIVESLSGLSLAVERTMTWDGTSYGGHGGTAVEAMSTTWYFAEGSQGFFDTYLLLANPGESNATVTVTYLREGESSLVRSYAVNALTRTTVFAGDHPELVGRSFSMVVQSDSPIIAERAMYWSRPGVFWAGGHESAGVAAPAQSWFLAEGATGPFFDEYVLIGNPNGTSATVSTRYLLPDGTTVVRTRTIDPQSRLTISVETEDPQLADVAVSTVVTSDVPIVVERAMYWPGDASQWQEAHNSFGLTELGTRWVLAEGRVGSGPGYETYVLLANPSSDAATVRVTFLRENGSPVQKTITVAAASRANVVVVPNTDASDAPSLLNESFGVLVESLNEVGVAVERAMYWNSGNIGWAGGTNTVGVRIE